jgi:uncharacterized cupredoxin-like copper-binding protein
VSSTETRVEPTAADLRISSRRIALARGPATETSLNAARLSIVVLAAAAALAAGCGGDDDEGAATDTAPTATERAAQPKGKPVATVEIVETDFELDPKDPTVAEAGVVKFTARNEGETVHALEVEGPKGEEETKEFGPGKSATLTVDLSEPGKYVMYCPVGNHRELGMEGTVTVAGGGSGGATGTETDGGGTGSGY